MVSIPDACSYDELDEKLRSAGADSGAAEAHGLLSGTLVAGGKVAPTVWLEHLLGEDNTLSAAAVDCGDMMAALKDDILRRFNDESFGFKLLLPVDDAPLSLRTDALGQWCGGFLYGLALGGIREDVEMPDSVREVMKDFYEISHARFVYEATDDEDETAYMEIVEYVRMSVLLLHEELQPVSTPARLH
jgi:yecA family protein